MDAPAHVLLPKKLDLRMLLTYYAAGMAVVGAAIFASIHWPYPAVQVVAIGVSAFVGKLLGMPLEKIALLWLHNSPEKAMELAIQVLQSLPADQAEAATKELISSIPPAALQRVVLVNTTEPPPSASPPLP